MLHTLDQEELMDQNFLHQGEYLINLLEGVYSLPEWTYSPPGTEIKILLILELLNQDLLLHQLNSSHLSW